MRIFNSIVGTAAITDASVEVTDGLAAVRELADHRLELWANAPVLDISLEVGSTAGGDWTITVRNTLVDAVLVADGTGYTRDADQHPTVGIFHVPLAAGMHTLRLEGTGGDGRPRVVEAGILCECKRSPVSGGSTTGGGNGGGNGAAAVLGHNFPGSEWYTDSYALLVDANLRPERNEKSWLNRAWNSLF